MEKDKYFVPFEKANYVGHLIYSFRHHFVGIEDKGCVRFVTAMYHNKEDDVSREVVARFVRELNGLYTFVSVYERPNDGEFECKNCHNIFPDDYMGTSELAIQDSICQQCMSDGYGR